MPGLIPVRVSCRGGALAVTAKLQVPGTAHTAIGHSPWQLLHLFYLARWKSNCEGFYIINMKISLEPFGQVQIWMTVNSLSHTKKFLHTVNTCPEWTQFEYKKLQHVGPLTCKIKMPKQIVCILASFQVNAFVASLASQIFCLQN